MRNVLLCLILLVFNSTLGVWAQEGIAGIEQQYLNARSFWEHNFTSFPQQKTIQLINDEVLALNKGFEEHPEFGLLRNAPCDNCYELLTKRTESSKTFAQINSKGSHIYVMSATEPLHYRNAKGEWLTIPRGMVREEEGIFSVFSAYAPIKVDAHNAFIQIGRNNNKVLLNSDLRLIFIDASGKEQNLGKANWSRYTAGNNGLHIIDAWPGIDITMTVGQGKIKTDYIIKEALPQYQSGKLIIRDALKFNSDILLKEVKNNSLSRFALVNKEGDVLYKISPAIGFEAGSLTSNVHFPFDKIDDTTLELTIDGHYLNLPAASYPFIIDPLFQSMDSLNANTMGTKNGGATDPCSYTNNVSVPEKVTITNLKFTFGYEIDYFNYPIVINNVGFKLRLGNSGGGNDCTTPMYTCDGERNPFAYQCYTKDFIPVHDDLKDCYPPPQCKSYDLPVILDFYRAAGPIYTCGNMNVAWNYLPFVVIVEGRTLELNSPISASSGSYKICRGDSIELSVKPEYGVPPYQYSWTPDGNTTQVIKIAPVEDIVYNVNIIDDCGNEVSAKANITVKYPSQSSLRICNAGLPYVWNGINIEYEGTFVYNTKNRDGCDSVVTLYIWKTPVKSDTITLKGCSPVPYKGKTYAASTTILDTMRAFSGCDSIRRTVNIQIQNTKLWFPNAFSPNGDGYNDEFGPELIGEEPLGYSLRIFDRWGTPLFASFNRQGKWNGTKNNIPVNTGTYFYTVTARCDDNTPIEEKGTLDLIR